MDIDTIILECKLFNSPFIISEKKGLKELRFMVQSNGTKFRVKTWGGLADLVETYLKSGKKIIITGKLKSGYISCTDIKFMPVK